MLKDQSNTTKPSVEITSDNAHTNIIQAGLNQDKDWFVSIEEAIAGWQLSEEVSKHLKKSPLSIYEKGDKIT